LSEENKKERKVIRDYDSSATFFQDSKKTVVRHTREYDDHTVEYRDEEISSQPTKLQIGGVRSDSLYKYLDNLESKNKQDEKKDGTDSDKSDSI
jgi:pyrroloquinoline quinone (PQQ) biosynthesis protein C